MTHYTYKADFGFDVLTFTADLAEASAPLKVVNDEGEAVSTQYQTADARHNAGEAAILLAAYYMGPDWWHDPSQPMPDDWRAHLGGMLRSITVAD